MTNVVSSLGVTQIMYVAFRSLLSPGDEVVLLEPAFDIYAPQVLLTGGTPRYISMKTDVGAGDNANDVFQVDWEALEEVRLRQRGQRAARYCSIR
jgi:aspartate/methionine/tyrosine aminotransferase